MAAGHKTGGRAKGTPNKRTLAREEAAEAAREQIAGMLGGDAFEGDAHALLTFVYKNPLFGWPTRIEAAGKALPYEKPRLGQVEHGTKGDRPLLVQLLQF